MGLIGRAHLAAVPDVPSEPVGGGLDGALERDDDIADLRAQRDAALGALAATSAQQWAAPAGGFQRNTDRREAEDDWAAWWWGRITAAHDTDDQVDDWRLIACRQKRGGS